MICRLSPEEFLLQIPSAVIVNVNGGLQQIYNIKFTMYFKFTSKDKNVFFLAGKQILDRPTEAK